MYCIHVSGYVLHPRIRVCTASAYQGMYCIHVSGYVLHPHIRVCTASTCMQLHHFITTLRTLTYFWESVMLTSTSCVFLPVLRSRHYFFSVLAPPLSLSLAPAPAPVIYCNALKLFYNSSSKRNMYVSKDVKISFSSYYNILQTDCSKYLLKGNFGSGSGSRFQTQIISAHPAPAPLHCN